MAKKDNLITKKIDATSVPTVDVTTNETVSNICEESQFTVTASSESKSDKTLLKKDNCRSLNQFKKKGNMM